MPQDLLLHVKTERALGDLLKDNPHATLLVGPSGAGKKTLGRYIANRVLDSNSAVPAAYFTEVSAEKTITIEQIRELTKFMQLKVPGSAAIRRVALVLNADTMTTEAQNALLKLLEEPPDDTMLLLTAQHTHSLLPTIRSRVQVLQISPPSEEQVVDYFVNKGHDRVTTKRAHSLSGGQVGLTSALIQGGEGHQLAQDILRAKELLQLSSFERLCQVDQLSKDKTALAGFLLACKRIAQSALEQSATKNLRPETQTWQKRLSVINSAEASLRQNANTKLLLTQLFITI